MQTMYVPRSSRTRLSSSAIRLRRRVVSSMSGSSLCHGDVNSVRPSQKSKTRKEGEKNVRETSQYKVLKDAKGKRLMTSARDRRLRKHTSRSDHTANAERNGEARKKKGKKKRELARAARCSAEEKKEMTHKAKLNAPLARSAIRGGKNDEISLDATRSAWRSEWTDLFRSHYAA